MNGQLKTPAQLFRESALSATVCLPARSSGAVAQHDFFTSYSRMIRSRRPKSARCSCAAAFQFPGSDAQRICHGQPHAAAAVINGQDASGAPTRRLYEFLHLTYFVWLRIALFPGPEQLMPEEAPDSQLTEKSWNKKKSASSTPRYTRAPWLRLSSGPP